MPPGLASGNEAVTAAALVDPFAPLADGFSIDNYRPVAGSAVALAGLGALAAQGEPPPPPPPPRRPHRPILLSGYPCPSLSGSVFRN
jgi:hypothetical protein